MYEFLRNLLSDKNGGEIFTCFGVWHICYIVSFLAIGICVCLYLRNKDSKERKLFTDGFINLAFITYIADFFLMPFAYGEIDIEKLPFHICTAMCVMCFLSRYNNFAKKYK